MRKFSGFSLSTKIWALGSPLQESGTVDPEQELEHRRNIVFHMSDTILAPLFPFVSI